MKLLTNMKKLILLAIIFGSSLATAQNVRVDILWPSVSSTNSPFLVANLPPNSPVLSVCQSPANAVPCTNYATTYTSSGVACPNGAQDTPQPQPSACQSSGDAQGNIGFWVPAGKYDITVCVQNDCGNSPYTITAGGSSSGGITGATPNGGLVATGTTLGLGNCPVGYVWASTGVLQWACTSVGSGGGGNVSTTPVASQNILQPVSTQFGVNNFEGWRYVDLNPGTFNWTQSVTASLSSGVQATVTLTPCPLGIFGTDTTSYISINSGAEYVQLQGGGTCVPGSSGTILFTPVGVYTNPTLGSASSGIQEALLDAESGGTTFAHLNNFAVKFAPTNPANTTYYAVNAKVTIAGAVADIDGSGASIDCEAPSACFYIGNIGGELVMHGFRIATKTTMAGAAITNTACSVNVATILSTLNPGVGNYVTIRSTDAPIYWGIWKVTSSNSTQFQFSQSSTGTTINCPGVNQIPAINTPGGAALEHAFLEDASASVGEVTLRDLYFDNPAWATGLLNIFIVNDNDQKFVMENLNGGFLNCSAAYCGPAIYAPGGANGFAIGKISNSQLSMQCAGNGIDWEGGGEIDVNGGQVFQGFNQFGIMGRFRGGSAQITASNLHEEIGNCANPLMTAAGFTGYAAYNMAGIITGGGSVGLSNQANGQSPIIEGQEPEFKIGGATLYTYWLVTCDGANCSTPMQFGFAAPPDSSSYLIGWPHVASAQVPPATITYYVLKTQNVASGPFVNYPQAPIADGTSRNISLTGSAIAQCSGAICTMNDSTATTLQAYTVSTNPSLKPAVWNWPGGVVLGSGASLHTDSGMPVTPVSPIVTTLQNLPSVFAQNCDGATPGTFAVCLNSSAGGTQPGGTLMQIGVNSGGMNAGQKGRLNFLVGPAGILATTDILTLNDSNSAKTLADPFHRPTSDAADIALGFDTGNVASSAAGLATRAPASISNYINTIFDGKSWVFRQTASQAVFSTSLVAAGGLVAATGGGTAFPSQLSGTQKSDNFAGSGSLGANWATPIGTWAKSNGIVTPTFAGCSTFTDCALATYQTGSFAANQYATVQVFPTTSGTSGIGPAVHASTLFHTAYACVARNLTDTIIVKESTGSAAILASGGAPVANGDYLTAIWSNGTLSCYDQGKLLLSVSDSSIATGNPGMWNGYTQPGSTVANFSGGDYVFTQTADQNFNNINVVGTCTGCGGGGGGLTVQTNTVNNISQTTLNMSTSTVNAAGITITPTNVSGGIVTYEATGTANLAAALSGPMVQCPVNQFPTGIFANGNANGCIPIGPFQLNDGSPATGDTVFVNGGVLQWLARGTSGCMYDINSSTLIPWWDTNVCFASGNLTVNGSITASNIVLTNALYITTGVAGGALTLPGAGKSAFAVNSSGAIQGSFSNDAFSNFLRASDAIGQLPLASGHFYAGVSGLAADAGNDFTLNTSTHTLAGGASGVLSLAATPAATGFKLPTASGASPTVDGNLADNSNNHTLAYGCNGSTCTVTQTVASGTATMATSAISSGTCTSAVTVAGTGILTTDVLRWSYNGDPTAVTGYAPSASGTLRVVAYPTAGNANFKVCNDTGGSITPGAITFNWNVTR